MSRFDFCNFCFHSFACSSFSILTGTFLLVSSAMMGCSTAPPPAPAPDPALLQEAEEEAAWAQETTTFQIQSTPSGAAVRLSSGERCKTPCTLSRPITENFDVNVDKKGFRGKSVSVISHRNVVPGSVVGGRPKLSKPKLSPNPLTVTLEPLWDR